jgi:hypothetical protein
VFLIINNIDMDKKENPSVEEIPEVVEGATQEGVVKEDPFAKGRERMAAIGGFFTKVKEKASSLTSRVSGGISRFFSRSAKVVGTGTAALLSGDDLAKKGAEWTDKKYGEIVEKVDQKLDKAEGWVADKADKADAWMSDTAEKAGAIVGEKYAQGKEWVGEVMDAGAKKYHQFEDLCASGALKVEDLVERSAKWVETKKQQAGAIVEEGVELAKDVAYIVEQKAKEGFVAAKEKVTKQYDSVVEFGENALVEAKLGYAEVKKKFRNTINGWRASMLRARIERRNAKNEKDLESLAKLGGLENKTELMTDVDQIEAKVA